MPLLIVLGGVALLLALMLVLRLNGFLALVLVSLAVGLAEGIPLNKVVDSVKNGMGGTLGNLALILGFGAMLGKLMVESGAAQRITTSMSKAGSRYLPWVVLASSFILGIPLFFDVGFVLMIPLVFVLATTANVPFLAIGIPMAAALSVTHGFLPPHPAPTALAQLYKADLGLTLVYGTILAVPIAILAGPVFAQCIKKMHKPIPKDLFNVAVLKENEMPGFWTSVFTGLTPVILMALSTISKLVLPGGCSCRVILDFIGDPVIALLLSVLVAVYTFGIARGKKMADVMKISSDSIATIAMILLTIGGGGAFKQVLVDGKASDYIVAAAMQHSSLSPLLLAWAIAALLRVSIGSATVSAMTAAGIVAPLIPATHARPELMVLATGAGSLIFSHVNDTGFWLFKEYFKLTIGETLKSWTVLETVISVAGLLGVLALNALL